VEGGCGFGEGGAGVLGRIDLSLDGLGTLRRANNANNSRKDDRKHV